MATSNDPILGTTSPRPRNTGGAKGKGSAIDGAVAKLNLVARQLAAGNSCSVTRLTSLKRLCTDHQAACAFVLHLAKLASRKSWSTCRMATEEKRLVGIARKALAGYQGGTNPTGEHPLAGLLRQLEAYQNEYKHLPWGPVRLIKSKRLLIYEQAIRCIIGSYEAPYWCYQVARDYAERYDSKFPDGLTPQSAPYVRHIAEFWKNR